MKDSQISKVFRAENAFLGETNVPRIWTIDWNQWPRDEKRLETELIRAQARQAFCKRYPDRWFPGNQTEITRSTIACGSHWIGYRSNSGWSIHQTNLWLYHQLAHFCARTSQHHAEFVSIYLDIVGQFLGVDAKRALKQCFLDEKVKTRVVSDATRAKQRVAFINRRDKGDMIERIQRLRSMAEEL